MRRYTTEDSRIDNRRLVIRLPLAIFDTVAKTKEDRGGPLSDCRSLHGPGHNRKAGVEIFLDIRGHDTRSLTKQYGRLDDGGCECMDCSNQTSV